MSETERKRHKVPMTVLCSSVALLSEVLIEDTSYSEIQTIVSNMHGEMERKTRRCVTQSVSWPAYRHTLFSFPQR